MAPKYTFPAQFHDCYAVVRTLLATGDKYGIDTSRLVVAGDSAGGNLATAVALKLRDEGKQLAAQVRTPQNLKPIQSYVARYFYIWLGGNSCHAGPGAYEQFMVF